MRSLGALCLFASVAHASPQRVQSGPTRGSLLELYTSEGCSSCPPAEELSRSLVARAAGRIIALAFHVDALRLPIAP